MLRSWPRPSSSRDVATRFQLAGTIAEASKYYIYQARSGPLCVPQGLVSSFLFLKSVTQCETAGFDHPPSRTRARCGKREGGGSGICGRCDDGVRGTFKPSGIYAARELASSVAVWEK